MDHWIQPKMTRALQNAHSEAAGFLHALRLACAQVSTLAERGTKAAKNLAKVFISMLDVLIWHILITKFHHLHFRCSSKESSSQVSFLSCKGYS